MKLTEEKRGGTIVLELIDDILGKLGICFKRKDTFAWFVTIIFGIIMRSDFRGITSILGALIIKPAFYHSALHFFRSTAFNLVTLKNKWASIVTEKFRLKTIDGRIFIIGDHTKVVKEAKYMPGIKKHHQESENSSKAEYIYGHDIGVIGTLTEGIIMHCVPLDVEIHGGSDDVNALSNPDMSESTSNYKLLQMVSRFVIETNRKSFLLLDAGFSTGEVFEETYNLNKKAGSDMVALITRAKNNYVGFEKPEALLPSGKTPKYGNKVELRLLFKTSLDRFTTANLNIYGKVESVQYLCLDLFWKPAKRIIRFVLVKTNEKAMILMCSDLNIAPEMIIVAYTYRFKIEVSFKNLKHVIGGFCYHFWTKGMPKLSKSKTKMDLSVVTKTEDISKISSTFRATQVFAFLSCIALGILMLLSETLPKLVWQNYSGWLRTYSKATPSIETTRDAVRNSYNRNYRKVAIYKTLSLIQKHQKRKKENTAETIYNTGDFSYDEAG